MESVLLCRAQNLRSAPWWGGRGVIQGELNGRFRLHEVGSRDDYKQSSLERLYACAYVSIT